MSPVGNQAPGSAQATFQYPAKTWRPRSSTSPSSAMRTAVPGSGQPTVPSRGFSGGVMVEAAVVSVSP